MARPQRGCHEGKAEINAAWKRLMNQVHPDKGGSNFIAKQLNEAREVLLE
jgi:curved DNA-binding protein CbpA